ncbi:hypothetical protein [Neptunomonas sp.]|uniref:hypothetical protein n=1 Tax=Neptunomonas TaxID=75687 RepID=UPI0035178EC7
MILKAEIEQFRTSAELKSFVEEVRRKVESDSDELQRARKSEGLCKVFVAEVMSLSQFSHLLYPAETTFLPVLGNQGYDVEVFDAQKNLIDRIEIAKPRDGQVEAEDSCLVNDRGLGKMVLLAKRAFLAVPVLNKCFEIEG